jgi:SPP1 gp7 family putative phage head morphogenesis protein
MPQHCDQDGRGPNNGEGMKAQARMANIRGSLRKALAVGDRRYFGDCARAVRQEDVPEAALLVQYPMIPEVEKAFREGVAASWHDANGKALEMLRRAGARRVLRGKAKTSNELQAASAFARSSQLAAHSSQPEAEAMRLILEGEDLVVPVDAVRRYAAGRVAPLRGTISEARKGLCRDIIARIAGEGGGTREAMRALEEEGFGSSAFHRENIARTEGTTLYNQGSVARYRASACVTGLRFVNPDDDRTTDECHDLNGMEFATDDIDGVTPPLHFECRSELEPILFDEATDLTTSAEYLADPETANPMPGFGGIDLSGFPAARGIEDLYAPLG